jgi:hypothetical protein
MTNTSSGTGLPTRRVAQDEEQNSSQEQSEPRLPRNELTLIKKLPSQIKEILEQNARIEHQLQGMNKDIKQISLTHPGKAESRESFKQIQSQIAQLQTQVAKTDKTIIDVLTNIQSKKGKAKKKGKKKGKKKK